MNLFSESLDLLTMGGWVSIPLLFCSGLLWYAVSFRWLNLQRGSKKTIRMIVGEAKTKRNRDGILHRAANTALNHLSFSHGDLRHAIEEDLKQYRQEISKFRSLIESLVMSAPLMGLLGTVIGMIETFDSLADMTLFTQSGGIAGGISQALITTQMGLIIAIPGLLFDRFLKRKEQLLQDDLTQIQEVVCQI